MAGAYPKHIGDVICHIRGSDLGFEPIRILACTGFGFVMSDGGREAAGFKPTDRDCVPRAVAIACDRPYHDVYRALYLRQKQQAAWQPSPSASGVSIRAMHDVVTGEYRWRFQPVTCPFRPENVPEGRVIVQTDGHVTAVIDHVIHDLGDPTGGPVYGIWTP